MTTFQKVLVGHAHPVNLILHALGVMWAIFFLWQNNWYWAAIFGLGLPIVGSIAAWGGEEKDLAKKPLGRLMLSHEHPVNLGFHIAGWVLVVYGLWIHEPVVILTAVSLGFIAHLWGWKKV